MPNPIAVVLFRRGAFDDADAAGTALVLMGLSLGLPAATLAKVFSQTLFAKGALRGAVMAALAGMGATAPSVLRARARSAGVFGLALGISLGCLVHAGVLVWLLHRRRIMARPIGRSSPARCESPSPSVLMGACSRPAGPARPGPAADVALARPVVQAGSRSMRRPHGSWERVTRGDLAPLAKKA